MLVWIDEMPEGLDQISAFSEDGNRAVRVRVESFTPDIHKKLVLEAGVAYEATGLTPSQLQARVAELEALGRTAFDEWAKSGDVWGAMHRLKAATK